MMKTIYGKLANYKTVLPVMASVLFVGSTHAELDPAAKAAVDQVTAMPADWAPAAFGIAAAVLTVSVGIKFFKKFVNKAT